MSLNGLHVMVTRPVHQAESLCQAILNQGGNVTRFPTLSIEPIRSALETATLVNRVKNSDLFIFVSQNAVRYMPNDWYPTNANILAIGAGTRVALEKNHSPTLISMPKYQHSSEGLLALPVLQHVKNQTIAIFAGEGGSTLLEETLTARGARVTKCELYRRRCPVANTLEPLSNWLSQIDVIVSTSAEGLSNLQRLLGERGVTWLQKTPLIVVSSRMESIAKNANLGQPILVTDDATDASILKTLKTWSDHDKPCEKT